MFSRLHDRLGTVGLIIAVVALVAALGGTAFAAAKLNSTQKKEVQKIATQQAKKFAKEGPSGPAGPEGPKGAQGPAGAAGAAGSQGPTGATGATGDSGATGATGATGTTGATGATGGAGSPWVVGTAPAGVLMKGTWSIPYYNAAAAGELVQAPISTGVPIDTNGEDFYKVIRSASGYEEEEEEEIAELLCPGTAANPTVDTSEVDGVAVLCVYTNSSNLMPTVRGAGGAGDWAVTSSGGGVLAGFYTTGAGVAKANGSWAFVTP